MKVHGLLVSAFALVGVVAFAQGCSADSSSGTSEDRICTAGAYVFCKCADKSEGTKLCVDGKSFEACTTNGAGQCIGGEVDDPRTGTEVEPPEEKPPVTSNLEACPGKATAVTPGVDIVLEGDTTAATDDVKGRAGACAAGSGGNDHIYRLTPTGSGALNIKVQGEGAMNPVAYVRTTCDDEQSQVSCAPPMAAGATVQINTNVVNGKDYFLVVDGASSSAGKYKVTARLTTGSFCGDGQVDTNEACDDGNKTEGDGCSNDCRKVEGDPTTASSCPGQPVHVWPGQTVSGSGSTTATANTFTSTGTSCTVGINNVAKDHVYEVTPHASGTLVVTATPAAGFNTQLVARRTCSDANTQEAAMCANLGAAGAAETMSFAVTNNQKVFVAVDGVLNGSGAYTITFRIQ